MDYTSGPYTVTFPAGITMIVFDVPINDDMIFEVDENFMLTINGTSLATGITCTTTGQATVTIVDNEILAGTADILALGVHYTIYTSQHEFLVKLTNNMLQLKLLTFFAKFTMHYWVYDSVNTLQQHTCFISIGNPFKTKTTLFRN